MYRTGVILGVVVFCCGVLDWLLLLTHYVEFVERFFPWLEHFANPLGCMALMLVGIVIFGLAWADRRKEKVAEQKEKTEPNERQELLFEHKIPSAASAAIPAPVSAVASTSPTQTVSPSIQVNPSFNIHPHSSQSTSAPTSHVTARSLLTNHNMKFISSSPGPGKHTQIMIAAQFENVPIAGQRLADFSWVRAKVEYLTQNEQSILTVASAQWIDSDHPSIEFRAGDPHAVLIAAFSENAWKAVEVIAEEDGWGSQFYKQNPIPLGTGFRRAKVTLIGAHNESLEPAWIDFTLFADHATVN